MKKQLSLSLVILCILVMFVSCVTVNKKPMELSSSAIQNGVFKATYGQFGDSKDIIEKNPATDESGNVVIMKVNTRSFPLTISNAPKGTKAYALYMHDPDAAAHGFGDFVHWVTVFSTHELKENASAELASSMTQGINGWGDTGFAGMGPPDKLGYTFVNGGPVFEGDHKYHTYILEVFALSAIPSLSNGFSVEQFKSAIENNILEQSEIKAIYFTDQADF